MNIIIKDTHDDSSMNTANLIIDAVNQKPNSVLCFAGGHTPLKTYEYLIQAEKDNKVNFSKSTFILLDEWVGIGEATFGSCIQTLNDALFKKLNIDYEKQVYYFDGLANDIEEEAKRIENVINQLGGLDICLLGVGMNGHLGFNEPGVDVNLTVGVIPLDPITAEVGKKYFNSPVKMEYGITIGLKVLLQSKMMILIADGVKKAEIVNETINGEISNAVPSSLARQNDNLYICLDKEAASKLGA